MLPDDLRETFPLIKANGEPFASGELAELFARLSALDADQREAARDVNADAIASHSAPRMLVVSGPGTGKSTLFISRLRHWLASHPDLRIAVATFVRKLVHDLSDDIANDTTISADDKKRVDVSSLHRLARSIVEQNHGTSEIPLKSYCRIISGFWEEMVWGDAVSLHPEYDPDELSWHELEDSLYDGEPRAEGQWIAIRHSHLRLQQFYNALTFPDLILFASQAVRENPSLVAGILFIIDEFQDFNLAEETFIRALTAESPGLLLAGDDDQVLYETLRRGHASIIRDYYQDAGFANAMLPYCSRCSLHVCRTAEVFLAANRPAEAIEKLYIPLNQDLADAKVAVVASTTPKTGVGYIRKFLSQHEDGIHARQQAIAAGKAKDPYLLVLTPARSFNFLQAAGAREQLLDSLAKYTPVDEKLGDDYWRVRDYFHVGDNPSQNFGVRKVLAHENVAQALVAYLIQKAWEQNKNFADLDDEVIANCITKAGRVKEIVESGAPPITLSEQLESIILVSNRVALGRDLERAPIGIHTDTDDEAPEFEQSATSSAVQLETIMGAKGLSADHVIVLGCDEKNLSRTTRNAFFVALTRARKSLTLMACIGGGGATMLHDFVRTLPDEHTQPLYVKADGKVEYETISGLQDKLERWAYAKKQTEKRLPKKT